MKAERPQISSPDNLGECTCQTVNMHSPDNYTYNLIHIHAQLVHTLQTNTPHELPSVCCGTFYHACKNFKRQKTGCACMHCSHANDLTL